MSLDVLGAVLTRPGSLYTALKEEAASLLWEDLSLTKGESERYWGEKAAPASQVNQLSPGGCRSQQMSHQIGLPITCRRAGLLDQPHGASKPVPVIEMGATGPVSL